MLKKIHFLEDTQERDLELRYFRDVEQREVDFVVTEDRVPILFIECKWSDAPVSPHLNYLKAKFKNVPSYQLTYKGKKDFETPEGIRVVNANKFLNELLF